MTDPVRRTGRRRSVALVGFGAVGRAFVRQVVESREALLSGRGIIFDISAICDSSGVAFPFPERKPGSLHEESGDSLDGLAQKDEILRDLIEHKSAGNALADHAQGHPCDGASEVVGDLLAHTVLVDCTASDAVTAGMLAHIDRGGAVALANKLPLVGAQSEFDAFEAASSKGRAAWEATVGSGVPIIATLRRLLDADDTVSRIEGTYSGTLNFIASQLRQSRPFSQIVTEARARSFTEPDPRADLGGLDMARKALILARMLGWRLDLEDVQLEGLYPPEMDALDVGAFMDALPTLDAEIRAKVEGARSRDAVFRHVATVADGVCSVGPTEVPADSPIGRLVGTDNLVTFNTRWYDPTPLVLQGRGAGVDATAAGVLADVVGLGIRDRRDLRRGSQLAN